MIHRAGAGARQPPRPRRRAKMRRGQAVANGRGARRWAAAQRRSSVAERAFEVPTLAQGALRPAVCSGQLRDRVSAQHGARRAGSGGMMRALRCAMAELNAVARRGWRSAGGGRMAAAVVVPDMLLLPATWRSVHTTKTTRRVCRMKRSRRGKTPAGGSEKVGRSSPARQTIDVKRGSTSARTWCVHVPCARQALRVPTLR